LTPTLAALQAQSFTYDANDRISGDTFDANGNTLTSGGVTYTYDFADRLVGTSTGVQIVYDGDGNRAAETAGGTTTKYLVDTLTPTGYAQVAEEIISGTVSAQYTYGLMRISQNRAGVVSYYGYDAGGSTRQLMNNAGVVTDTYAYDAFGNTVAQTGSTTNSYQYGAEQFDASLQMYYLRARYYRPLVGRFLNKDKFEGDDEEYLNLPPYTYANADPVNGSDPTGNEVIVSRAAISAFLATQLAPHAQRIGQLARGLNSLGLQSKDMALWLQQNLLFYGRAPYNQAITRTVGWMQALNPKTGEVIEATAISGLRTYFPAALRSILSAFPNVARIASYGGLQHAEEKLVQWALDRGYYIISIGAGRPICETRCVAAIEAAAKLQPFPIFYQ
jgi:RHS repeat-associated protein